MKTKKSAVILSPILLFSFLGIIFFILLYALQRNTVQMPKAAPATTLSFQTPAATVQTGQIIPVNLIVSSGTNSVLIIESEVVYDPTIVRAIRFEKSPTFTNMIGEEIFLSDRVKFSVATASPAQPLQGQASFGTIYFETIQETQPSTAISYSSATFVGALDSKQTNALLGSTPILLTVRNQIISPTPTPSPTKRGRGNNKNR